MIDAACHCGAVRFAVASAPKWVLDCNCSICRRYGGLWTYMFGDDAMDLVARPDPKATETYLWGDHELAFHRCKVCGCITHSEAVQRDPPVIFTLNARLMVGLDGASIPVRRRDNGHLGWFWTREDEPVRAGNHPPPPPPGPNDWR
ncbi:MAG: aldehyde-activating protein [Phenylobacterium zucineum]|nr:MAG: aldehyde-activating protein [Phenylobacterium zucineum]